MNNQDNHMENREQMKRYKVTEQREHPKDGLENTTYLRSKIHK